MRLLLDTHIVLWALTDDERLSGSARAMINNPGNSVAVSAASIWEIAIKHGLRRGGANAMQMSSAQVLEDCRGAGYDLLPVTPEHAAAVETLPPLHGDPFDRLLVAQALTEPMRLLTHDRALAGYGEMVLLV